MKKSIYLLFILITSSISIAQPGKDGVKTVTGTIVLNKYSPVTSNISSGTTSLSVISQAVLLGLCPGDLIMIYQAQGATISATNTIIYGSVNAYNNAGLFEYVYVNNINGNTINLASALVNNYTATGMVQVIKVPQYTTLILNAGAFVNSKPWKDTIVSTINYRFGGVIAIHATTINNNGTINANGAGFRGGQLDIINQAAYTSSVSNYVSTINYYGGEKGEGIAGYQLEYDLLNGRYGRGAAANGGGGGNSWNAGGGGGANANNGNIWTGQGVMIVDAANPLAAWQLDPGYIANSNALTNSSGGGRGGYSVGYINQNATVTGPNNPSWGLDGRCEMGGLGGRPLTNINYNNRIYFGGGGGAGDENNANSNNGGNGGGLVFLIATANILGNGIISSNGSNGGSTTGTGYDAASGAGAGGSIVILTGAIASTQTITAKGGNGGNQYITATEFEGPGGGGGGGYVAISSSAVVPLVAGGINGNTNSSSLTEFPANGATAGANGISVIATNTFISYNASAILTITGNSPVCSGTNLNLNASLTNALSYNWAGPNTFSSASQNTVIANAQTTASGIYTVSATVTGCPPITNTYSVSVNPLPVLTITGATLICSPGQITTLSVTGATSYTWSTNSNASTITVAPVISTTYTVTGSALGCTSTATVNITVADCMGLTEQHALQLSALVFPNPSSGIVNVSLNKNARFDLSVCNSIGQVIWNAKNLNEASVDLSLYSKGIYYFIIRSEAGFVSKKITIQ